MTAELDAIRALAEAATPGPWTRDKDWTVLAEDNVRVGATRLVADAAYIAAVDPQTVLALLAALDRAEAVVAAADKVVRKPGANAFSDDWDRLHAALRAYEDADKVADG